MATGKPTPKQKKLLEKFGINPPPSEAACKRFIKFILHGNAAGRTQTVQQRIGQARAYQSAWDGKRVIFPETGSIGLVQYIYPKSVEEVLNQVRWEHMKSTEINPFVAVLLWDKEYQREGRKHSLITVGSLELLDD